MHSNESMTILSTLKHVQRILRERKPSLYKIENLVQKCGNNGYTKPETKIIWYQENIYSWT